MRERFRRLVTGTILDLESREIRPGWPVTDQVLDGGAFPKGFFSRRTWRGRGAAMLSESSSRVAPSREQITSGKIRSTSEDRPIMRKRDRAVNQLASPEKNAESDARQQKDCVVPRSFC